jgi:uncharacterized RmlC-like cupin family protein
MPSQTKSTCKVVHPSSAESSKQGLTYFPGISAENAGAQAICMHIIHIPPGGKAKAHLHENHETTLYVLEGEAGMWFGERLEQHVVTRAGDILYIPANMPHQPYNRSQTQPCSAIAARTDPNEQESVILLPHLEGLH